MDRGEVVVLDHSLRDEDRVLEVVPTPGHERDAHVARRAPSRRDPSPGRPRSPAPSTRDRRARTIGRWLMQVFWLERWYLMRLMMSTFDPLPSSSSGLTTIRAASTDSTDAISLRHDRHARVPSDDGLHAGSRQRRLRPQQRHGLAHHVRAHQCAVRIIVLEERDQTRPPPTRAGSAKRPSCRLASGGTIMNSPCLRAETCTIEFHELADVSSIGAFAWAIAHPFSSSRAERNFTSSCDLAVCRRRGTASR